MNEKQTPLIDLLRAVPADARMTYEHSEHHHQMIPVGRLCHEAAEALSAHRHAEAELERCRVQLAGCGVVANGNTREAIERNTLPTDAYGYSASYASCLLAAQREVEERERAERAEEQLKQITDFVMGYWPLNLCWSGPMQAIGTMIDRMVHSEAERDAAVVSRRKDIDLAISHLAQVYGLLEEGDLDKASDYCRAAADSWTQDIDVLDNTINAARGKNDNITTSSE